MDRSLDSVAGRLIHGARRSLDNHLLAGADQARTFLPNACEGGIELFFGLNPSGEVAAKLHGRDTIAVNDAVQLGDRILQTGLAGIQLRPELWNRHAPLIPCRAALQRRRQLLLLILVDASPAGRLREPFEGLSIGGNPRFQRFVEPPRILGVNRRRVLLDSRQLAIEGLARQQVFELSRLGSKVLAYVLLIPQEGPGLSEALRAPDRGSRNQRLGQCLIQLGGAFDGVLDGSMRRVEGGDCIVL